MVAEDIKISLSETIKRTDTVQSFRFLSQKKIDFIAGQFLQIFFDEASWDNKELNKYLSFSSSPTKEYIEVTKRLGESNFSQRLRNLKPSDAVLIRAPLGNCIFKEEYKKTGFLIGGIGITPVISIIEYIKDKEINTDVCLLYSNRSEEEIAFRKELDNWQGINKNIRVHYFVSDQPPKEKNIAFSRIDRLNVEKHMPDLKERIIFIFGPPKMVEAMKGLCLELGMNPDTIKTEMFIGY